jgi:hypothetical protein
VYTGKDEKANLAVGRLITDSLTYTIGREEKNKKKYMNSRRKQRGKMGEAKASEIHKITSPNETDWKKR